MSVLDLSKLDLYKLNMFNMNISNIDFTNMNISNIDFTNMDVTNMDIFNLYVSIFAGSNLDMSNLGLKFTNWVCKIWGWNFRFTNVLWILGIIYVCGAT